MIILAAEAIAIVTILETISKIPDIVGRLKLGVGGKGDVNDLKIKLKNLGTLGHSIKDYFDLLTYTSAITIKTERIIRTYFPDTEKKDKMQLDNEYRELSEMFVKWLSVFFNPPPSRFVDRSDTGTLQIHITDINNSIHEGSSFLTAGKYDKLEGHLKDIHDKTTAIASLCNPRIYAIAKELETYEYKFGGI